MDRFNHRRASAKPTSLSFGSPSWGRSRPASVSSHTARASRGPPCWPGGEGGREGGKEGGEEGSWPLESHARTPRLGGRERSEGRREEGRGELMKRREGGGEGRRKGFLTGVEMESAQGGGRAALPGRGHGDAVIIEDIKGETQKLSQIGQ